MKVTPKVFGDRFAIAGLMLVGAFHLFLRKGTLSMFASRIALSLSPLFEKRSTVRCRLSVVTDHDRRPGIGIPHPPHDPIVVSSLANCDPTARATVRSRIPGQAPLKRQFNAGLTK
jgi:hypothetical protein